MNLTVKTKIWLTIGSIVGVFTAFLLLFFPAQQERYFLRKYNGEIQNLARTVALGAKIAMTEQNFEGVQMALDFAKKDSRLDFVTLLPDDSSQAAATRWLAQKGLEEGGGETIAGPGRTIVKRAVVDSPNLPGQVIIGFTTDEITRQMREIRLIALGVSALVFAFGIGVGWWLARTISKPVLALRDAAIRVGSGDRTQHVTTSSRDEIGELTAAFNRMVADLAAAEARDQQKAHDLAEKNRLIEQSRDELEHALQDLKQTQSQLVHSEKMASLGQMTAGVAHEINNPINFVSVGIDSLRHNIQDIREVLDEYLKLRPDGDEAEMRLQLQRIEKLKREIDLKELVVEAEALFASIKNGARRTTEIVKSLRNFSRLDEDTLKPARLEEGLDSTLVILHNQLKDRIKIEKHYAPLPEINCYPGPLNQVFMNILTNAIQAVDGPGTIGISTSEADGYATVRIRDSGCGMTPEVQARIFDPFYTTKDVGVGTGLGLSITFGIIEKHQGRIRVESAAGEGTTFIIEIPMNLAG